MIGAGPVGLHAAFYAGLRGLSVRLLEAQPEIGGQLSALYPDKVVYDWPGLPAIRAAEIVAALAAQLAPFNPEFRFGEVAQQLTQTPQGWTVTTQKDSYPARALIVAAGLGALLPRGVQLSGVHPDVRTLPPDPQTLEGQRVLIVGGVPQAVEAALKLSASGARVSLTHRRALFRGSPAQLAQLQSLRESGQLHIYAPAELSRLDATGAWLDRGDEPQHVAAATVVVLNGHLPELTPLQSWPLGWQGEYIPADAAQRTVLPGVFVAGDLSLAGGDFKLLSVGLAQAALAANHAVHFVRPDQKAKPGHSSDRRLP
ncbi:NAD(P)/FAD-dependent oxidoreductase [Deinococcus psychrotolerans]|uniref:Ferredoxin--NADP reductase n=1 Tax=Deinococcus psychrotolerans TaxID=2489213 RepID=A0A3G8YFL1_9DEIO|nr:NAD(P)/FAD-dependent oxidoreductase [Deinococcus psychrotolerans]